MSTKIVKELFALQKKKDVICIFLSILISPPHGSCVCRQFSTSSFTCLATEWCEWICLLCSIVSRAINNSSVFLLLRMRWWMPY